jgi:arylsulfatase A
MGIYDWIPADSPMHLAKSEITVAALLKQAGYDTCHVGKWHLNGKFNSPDQPQPNDHGFEYWMATQNNAAPSHENPRNFVRNGKAVGALEGFSCQLVADEAIRWLSEKREPKKPFFQFVAFHEPHEPVASPPALVKAYADLDNENKAQHHANISNMDNAVGRLLAALDELNVAENTLVFFTSDNGPETFNRYRTASRSFGSPGELRGMKLWLYEGGIRVPGIVRWPATKIGGRTNHEPISNLDVLPTFCELARVKPPADRDLDGASFVPIFENKPIARKTPLYWHYIFALGEPRAAMRDGDWVILGKWKSPLPKTIARGKSEPLASFELYNLRSDPKQERDLALAMPEKVKELSATLIRKYTGVQAAGPQW